MSPTPDEDAAASAMPPTTTGAPGGSGRTPDTTEPDGPRQPAGQDRNGWRRGIALLVVLAAAAAAGLWGLTQGSSDPDPLEEPREVARRFGSAYLTFDSDSVAELGDRLLAMGTEDFVSEYESARLPGVEQLFSDSDVSTRADVNDVFTTGIDDDRVRAVVFVDVVARGPEGEQRLQNLPFVLQLEAVDGEWLVDAVAPLPAPEVVGDGTSSTTTTTAPSATTTAPPPPTAPPAPGG